MTHIDTQAMSEQKVFTSESSECFLQKLSDVGPYQVCDPVQASLILRLPSLFSDSLLEVTVMGYQMKRTITLTKKKIWMGLNAVGNILEEINNSAKIYNTCLVVFKHFKYVA